MSRKRTRKPKKPKSSNGYIQFIAKKPIRDAKKRIVIWWFARGVPDMPEDFILKWWEQ